LSDADVAAASSRRSQTILLTLTGTVAEPLKPLGLQVAAVPEPGLLALLGVGVAQARPAPAEWPRGVRRQPASLP